MCVCVYDMCVGNCGRFHEHVCTLLGRLCMAIYMKYSVDLPRPAVVVAVVRVCVCVCG